MADDDGYGDPQDGDYGDVGEDYEEEQEDEDDDEENDYDSGDYSEDDAHDYDYEDGEGKCITYIQAYTQYIYICLLCICRWIHVNESTYTSIYT